MIKFLTESKFRNSRKQGDAGMGLAIAWLATQGYKVSIPLTDSQDYDLVAEIDGTLAKVQVKTTFCQRFSKFLVNLSVKGGNRSGTGKIKKFNPASVEFIFIATADGSYFFIPTSEIKCTDQLILGAKYDRFMVQRAILC